MDVASWPSVRRSELVPPPLRPLARRLYRATAQSRVRRNLRLLRSFGGSLSRPSPGTLRFLLTNQEPSNFTYAIANLDELARFLGAALGESPDRALAYVHELEGDDELRRDLESKLRSRPDRSDRVAYGRRLGWYAAVRIAKPRLVVETGTHDGLGSAALLRALERNAAEGVPGRLASFDVSENAGWLVDGPLRERFTFHRGDTRELLGRVLEGQLVDLFIHDSEHTYDHETFEFEEIWPRVGPTAVLISDNSHAGTAFSDFCARHGLDFRFFREQPARHPYPGAGIGLAVVRAPGGPARRPLP